VGGGMHQYVRHTALQPLTIHMLLLLLLQLLRLLLLLCHVGWLFA
jgi:hypothetical protein